ncbi:DUF1307 domain-containing protein [Enterococcus wangshanyuanii]|uniref:Uncharacterized protein n=1 Tax=Enterococcus wangshanyuanii TaxID=2005703 RepID=A0ABQ1PSM7_9ENTE|nr:DUF1307 domain-containing protein [Enterococcus wangshanyuanii]GGD02933.1 hypothetical protein GCM10011573_35500 [Enterococcus wangshanyuanii]
MKKFLGVISMIVLVAIASGCGKKEETTTFIQTPTIGTEVSVKVKHEGDKVTGISNVVKFDNAALGVTDEESAKEIVRVFKETSEISTLKVEMTYTEKETTITYPAMDLNGDICQWS